VTVASLSHPVSSLDVTAIRSDFPIFKETVYGKPLIYLDNGATTHKPQCVIDRITNFYSNEYGTVRRGVYAHSMAATDAFNHTRNVVAQFINAPSPEDIIFVRGTTEAINLVAHSYGLPHIGKGDAVLITEMEHHANTVPWQLLCQRTGAELRVIPLTDSGELDLTTLDALLTSEVKLLAVTHLANSLGTVNPIKDLIDKAHAVGAVVLVDGAQSAPHMAIDVQALDCDFYCFSGHKVYGPTGVGVLYAKRALQEVMIPYQSGGDMIATVDTVNGTTIADPPGKFEAGTPAIASVVALAPALEYLTTLGLEGIASHEAELLAYATEQLKAIEGLRIIGQAQHKSSLISFVVDGAHPLDIGTMLDQDGIAIRTGHHCAQPVMRRYGVSATARLSVGVYNTRADIDTFMASLMKTLMLLR